MLDIATAAQSLTRNQPIAIETATGEIVEGRFISITSRGMSIETAEKKIVVRAMSRIVGFNADVPATTWDADDEVFETTEAPEIVSAEDIIANLFPSEPATVINTVIVPSQIPSPTATLVTSYVSGDADLASRIETGDLGISHVAAVANIAGIKVRAALRAMNYSVGRGSRYHFNVESAAFVAELVTSYYALYTK